MKLRTHPRLTATAWALTGAVLAALCALAPPALAQTAASSPASAPASGAWQLLSARDKRALAPLAARWGELTDTQRSKWRTIVRQFDQLSPADQAVMHARMTEWVALTPTQRNQARLNFNTVHDLPKDEKKSKWDAYQALSDAQKRELSAGVLRPSKTAAPSPQPANAQRLVPPAVRTLPAAAIPARAPIDQKTLLPLPLPATASEPPAQPGPASDAPAREASAS